jgi:hypothetical protein
MEEIVLGTKRAIPFWRAKRPLLSLERALSSLRQLGVRDAAMTVPAVVQGRARSRLAADAKKMGRFAER